MLPSTVFEYLIGNGAEVVGTTKRMAKCWPFTFQQKLKDNDPRTLVDVRGAPTLYLKHCMVGVKPVFASAFRNGTDQVATAVSSIHTRQEWEGIALKPSEKAMYDVDKEVLSTKFFRKVEGILPNVVRDSDDIAEEEEMIDELLSENIEPFTIRQGKSFKRQQLQKNRKKSNKILHLVFCRDSGLALPS